MESAFPTLKRGANEHCAYGAAGRTLLLQQSIKPTSLWGGCGTFRLRSGQAIEVVLCYRTCDFGEEDWNSFVRGLLIPAEEICMHRPYGTPEFMCGIRFPHAEARG